MSYVQNQNVLTTKAANVLPMKYTMTDYAKHIALANTPASSTREYANDHMAE